MEESSFMKNSIKSFVRRGGRLSPTHQDVLKTLWPHYGLSVEKAPHLSQQFLKEAPLVLEIGFGNGEHLFSQAHDHPENNYIGIEVYRGGLARLLTRCLTHPLSNLKLLNEDATTFLAALPPEYLEGVFILFPDPWPKTRHHKRRLIQPNFVECVWHTLKEKGWVHCATDWEPYARAMMNVFSRCEGFKNYYGVGQFAPSTREMETKFERRGKKLGHCVKDLLFNKISSKQLKD